MKKKLTYERPRQEIVAFSAASGLLQGSPSTDEPTTTIGNLGDPEDISDPDEGD